MEYVLKNNEIKVKVSSLGAQIISLQKKGKEFLWQGDKKYWTDQAPNLFPYIGRFTNGKYSYKEHEYHMDIHGFAKDLEYELVAHSDTELELEITNTRKTYEIYPFSFSFVICYRVVKNSVQITYRITNKTNGLMYFGVGGHPGFSVPLEEGLNFEDYYLEFGENHVPVKIGHTSDCFLSGNNNEFYLENQNKISLKHTLFDDDAIVLGNVSNRVTLKSDKGKSSVTLDYPKMSYLGIWHAPRKEAPYICIEPWTSLPSRKGIVENFSCKSDLICLDIGERYINKWSITLN